MSLLEEALVVSAVVDSCGGGAAAAAARAAYHAVQMARSPVAWRMIFLTERADRACVLLSSPNEQRWQTARLLDVIYGPR